MGYVDSTMSIWHVDSACRPAQAAQSASFESQSKQHLLNHKAVRLTALVFGFKKKKAEANKKRRIWRKNRLYHSWLQMMSNKYLFH